MSSLTSWPAGMLGPAPTAPIIPGENNSVQNKLTEIVNFWKFKKQHWFQPSGFVKSFQHVFDALVNVRNLRLNSDVALERLFPSGAVQYKFGIAPDVERPGEYIDTAFCIWPGQSEWVTGTGFSKEQAKQLAAYQALKIILGNQFLDYCKVSASSNYVGIDAEELRLAFLTEGLQTEGDDLMGSESITMELAAVALGSNSSSDRTEPVPVALESHEPPVSIQNTFSVVSLFPSELAGDILDPNILTWGPENWKSLSKIEKEDILFQFWVKTSSEKFPFTMNLLLTRYPFGNCALGAFMLLFSEGQKIQKRGVQWKTLETEDANVKVHLTWRNPSDRNTVVRRHVGTGVKLDHARKDAARQALRTIYTPKGLEILEHASQGFFFDEGMHPVVPLSREALHDRLKQAKKNGVMFTSPVRVPSSTSDGRGSGVNGHSSNQTNTLNNLPLAAPQCTPSIPIQVLSSRHESFASSGAAAIPPVLQDPPTNFVHPGQLDAIAEASQHPVTFEQNPAPVTSQEPSSFPVRITSPVEPNLSAFDINGNSVQAEEDRFAEYFSDSPDGLISVPDWVTQKYFQREVSTDSVESLDFSDNDDLSQPEKAETPFLPFDKIIGYNYPEEAAVALDLLFEDRRNESGPKYETCKYVLAEVQVGSQTFQAFGSTVEEAQEKAAEIALKALQDSSD